MDVYVAICCDRHLDVEVGVCDTPEKAIQYAQDFITEHSSEGADIEEEDITGTDYLYQWSYSCEGDYVFVVKKELL
jgi:hypothetical protein